MTHFLSVRRVVWLTAWLALSAWDSPAQEPNRGTGLEAAGGSAGVPAMYEGTVAAATLQRTVSELDRRERYDDVELYVEQAVRRHPDDWRVLFQGARIYAELERSGYWIGGRFRRGDLNGSVPENARRVYSHDRDHRRALQLLDRAIRAIDVDGGIALGDLAPFYWEAAQIFTGHKGYLGLYEKTDLETLPALSFRQPMVLRRGAVPLDADGSPLFFELPASWGDARNDGERLLWLLNRARNLDPQQYNAEAEFIHAKYLLKDYLGVQTVTESPSYDPVERVFEGDEEARRLLDSIDTLTDGETVCLSGESLQRIDLPDKHNYIKRFQAMAQDSTMKEVASEALQELAECYENRRQYEAAAACWSRCVQRFGAGEPAWEQERLDQIVKNWGFFENVQPFRAGEPVRLGYWFRNGNQVAFRARRLDAKKLVDDILAYLESDPFPLDPDRIDVAMLGKHVIMEGGEKYLGETVAEWSRDLEPSPHHWDAHTEIEVPIREPGAYWVEGTILGGNTNGIVVWINDLSILRRPLEGSTFYHVTNTITGLPAGGARFSFIGFRLHLVNQAATEDLDEHGEEIPEALRRQYHVTTKEIHHVADAVGQLILDDDQLVPDHRWFLLATSGNSAAILGFSDLKPPRMQTAAEEEARYFVLTDREVYLPGRAVQFRGWLRVRRPTASLPEYAVLEHESVEVVVVGPDGEPVSKETVTADVNGSIAGSCRLPEGVMPGAYHLVTMGAGGRGWTAFDVAPAALKDARLHVRVEDRVVARGKPVKLRVSGEDADGDPLGAVKVRYEVREHAFTDFWYREGEHEWLFGRGYTYIASPYSWLPGWETWGWPAPPERGTDRPSPVVLAGELTLNETGEAEISLPTLSDTAANTARIEAGPATWTIMVRTLGDAKSRVESTDDCVVSDHRVRAYAALDRSHYAPNSPALFEVWLRDYRGQALRAAGSLVVERLTLSPGGDMQARGVYRMPLTTDDQGYARCTLGAHVPGLFRASFQFRHEGKLVVGGAAATVKNRVSPPFGEGGTTALAVSLLTDKAVYDPGETVRLTIANGRPGDSVALFVRPRDGHYGKVEIVSVEGADNVMELETTQDDIPSFFVEAISTHEGDIAMHRREIVVAPRASPLTVTVRPDKPIYRPGETATLTLDLSDATGNRCGGRAVVSIAPATMRASEAAASLPSVRRFGRDIRRFFWDTRAAYEPAVEHALMTTFQSFSRPLDAVMRPIGLFGAMKISSVGEPALFQELTSLPGAVERPAPESPDYAEIHCGDPVVWLPDVVIPETGHLSLSVPLPNTFGEWRARVWVLGEDTRAGFDEETIRTDGGWQADSRLPRLAVWGDTLTLTSTVWNRSREPLTLEGKVLLARPGLKSARDEEAEKKLSVAGGARETVSWRFHADEVRDAVSMVKVHWQEAGEGSGDRISWEQPVRVLPRQSCGEEVWNGAGQGEAILEVALPEIDGKMEADLTFSVGAGIVPAIHEVMRGSARRTAPEGSTAASVMARLLPVFQWHQAFRSRSDEERQVFESLPGFAELTHDENIHRRIEIALARLKALQRSDGGWGWAPSSEGLSRALPSAMVVHGLNILVENGVEKASPLLEEGLRFLQAHAREQRQALQNARMGKTPAKARPDALDALVESVVAGVTTEQTPLSDALWADWRSLPVFGQVLLALALHHRDEVEDRNEIRFHLGEQLHKATNGAIELKGKLERREDEGASWVDDENSLHAFYLRFLTLVKGDNPVADGVALQLLTNRRASGVFGGDMADLFALDALNGYVWLKPESLGKEGRVELEVNGGPHSEREWKAAGTAGVVTFEMPLDEMGAGSHRLALRSEGPDLLVVHGRLSLCEDVPVASAEGVFSEFVRHYRRPRAGTAGGTTSESPPFVDGEKVGVGEIVEVALRLRCRQPLERVVLFDRVAGGFAVESPVVVAGAEVVEEEDGRLAFYFESLPAGEHVIRYRIKAVLPGDYWALPAKAWAPYDRSGRAQSDERFFLVRP